MSLKQEFDQRTRGMFPQESELDGRKGVVRPKFYNVDERIELRFYPYTDEVESLEKWYEETFQNEGVLIAEIRGVGDPDWTEAGKRCRVVEESGHKSRGDDGE